MSCLEKCPCFRGVLIEGFHCNHILEDACRPILHHINSMLYSGTSDKDLNKRTPL